MKYEYAEVGAANPGQMIALLNEHGIKGWRVIHIANNPTGAHNHPWVAFLEREIKGAAG